MMDEKCPSPLSQHPSPGSELQRAASSLPFFSLVYSANTELGAEMGAKACFFLPWFPFSREPISTTVKLLLLLGGSHYAPLLGALGFSLGWETVVSDLNFNSNLNLGGKCYLLGHACSLFHTPPVPAALSVAKCENGPYCGHKPLVSKLAYTLESPGELQTLRMPVSHTQRL